MKIKNVNHLKITKMRQKRTIRVNVTLTEESYNLAMEIKKKTDVSLGEIYSRSILRAYHSPMEFLLEQKRYHAKQMNVIDIQIKELTNEELRAIAIKNERVIKHEPSRTNNIPAHV